MLKAKKSKSHVQILKGCGKIVRALHQQYCHLSKSIYECQSCGTENLKRVFPGVWSCTKCKCTYTGKAYTPK